MEPQTEITTSTGDYTANAGAFERSLRAEHLSPATIRSYTGAVAAFGDFLAAQGMPRNVGAIRREHVEAFTDDLLARRKPATAINRYRGLARFFGWLEEEGEVKPSPMQHTKQPRAAETDPPAVLRADDLERLFAAARAHTFVDRRDLALLRILADTGLRRAEVAGLRFTPNDPETMDVNLDAQELRAFGKGRKWRIVAYGNRAAKALDSYLRERARHPDAESPWLWLGRRGRLTDSGIAQAIHDRGIAAGLGKLHPHQFRHSAVSTLQARGVSDTALMRAMGWTSRQMLSHYAAATGQDRALAEVHRALDDRS